MAAPQSAKLSGTVKWSDNTTLFDGYVLLGIVPATHGGTEYTDYSIAFTYPRRRLPPWIVVPIEDGEFKQDAEVWFNSSIDPPATRYVSYWYDLNDRLIASNLTPFTIATAPYAITVPTLTIPTTTSSIPSPDTVPTVTGTQVFITVPTEETPAGVMDGVNATFTITRSPSFMMLFLNATFLKEGTGYTRSGTTITMLSGYIPESGDVLRSVLW